MKYLNVRNISRIAILGALGAVLLSINPIAILFYKFDLGDLPCLIGAFAMGPIPAFFIQVIKIIIKLIFKPTSTKFVGEITAFIFSCALTIPAGYIYQRNRTRIGAIRAMVISSIIMVIVACLTNYYYSIPFYADLYQMPVSAIVSMGSNIIPIIKNLETFILYLVLPFNILQALLVDIITLLIYKRIVRLIK